MTLVLLMKNLTDKEWPTKGYLQLFEQVKSQIQYSTLEVSKIRANQAFRLDIEMKLPQVGGIYEISFMLVDTDLKQFGEELKVKVICQDFEIIQQTLIESKSKFLEIEGYGNYEDCFNAIVSSEGDVEKAKKILKNSQRN